jgi:exodeoxyribonuclease III
MSNTIISWNVNSLNALLKKTPHIINDLIKSYKPIAICLQETKLTDKTEKNIPKIDGYKLVLNNSLKKGYSGVGIYINNSIKYNNITFGMNIEKYDNEGRIITLEYDNFYLVNVYTVNSGTRFDYRIKEWDPIFSNYIKKLLQCNNVIICGDMNVGFLEIDTYKGKLHTNKLAGFTDEERSNFKKLLDIGFVDGYRKLYPEEKNCFTFWDYKYMAKQNNRDKVGLRLDYFLLSQNLTNNIEDIKILKNIYGSDHCPILLELKL